MMQIKRFLKFLVIGLQAVLPEAAFQRFYDWAFPIYNSLTRFLYLIFGTVWARLRGDGAAEMVKFTHTIMPYTLVGVGGLHATYRLASGVNVQKVEGDLVELGVAQGGCAALMGTTIFRGEPGLVGATRRLVLFDSYEGLPEPSERDFQEGATGRHVRPLPKGSCLGTLAEVKHLMFDVMRFPEDRITFVRGWFNETIPTFRDQIDSIAVLRIDGDWYESVRDCLEGLYDKVSVGGAVICDDYDSCFGAKKALDEFITNNQLDVEIHLDGRGGCWFMKGEELKKALVLAARESRATN
jgi:macrocin-O-methyltransferase TylF-like protien